LLFTPGIDGENYLRYTCSGFLGDGSCTFKQCVPTDFSLNGVISIYASTTHEGITFHKSRNGTRTISTDITGTWKPYTLQGLLGDTETCLEIDIPVLEGEVKVVNLDNAKVGYERVVHDFSNC